MSQATCVSTTITIPSPARNAEQLFRTPFRAVPMVGDSMEPTARAGDVFMCVPADEYVAEGLYVVEALGKPVVYRASHEGAGILRLSLDNPRYPSFRVDLEQFAAMAIGRVFAVAKIVDPRALERLLHDRAA